MIITSRDARSQTTASRFTSADANMETSGEYRIMVIAPLCFSRTTSSLRLSPAMEYKWSLPSWPPTIASVPSGEITDAVTVNPRFMVDSTFVPRRRMTPVSNETKVTSGELRARLKSLGWVPTSIEFASPHWSPSRDTLQI